jgi:hypothetical protein
MNFEKMEALHLFLNKNEKITNNIIGDNMKVSWIKSEKDKKSFRLPENLGFDVYKIKEQENIDNKIDELVQNKYTTIIISNELAGFSQKINKDYMKNKEIEIIISKDTIR